MDALLLTYNLFLIILYSITIVLTLILYAKEKENCYLYITILFGFYILDSLTLYLIDFVESFAAFYNNWFSKVPTLKTLVFCAFFFCIIKIIELILDHSAPVSIYIVFVALITFLLFVPATSNYELKVWLYYSPASLFRLFLGLYGLVLYHNIPINKRSQTQQYFRFAIYILILGSLAIFLEDALSFINSNSYFDLDHRNVSEDIMSILFSVLAIVYLIRKIENPASAYMEPISETTLPNTETTEIPAPGIAQTLSSGSPNSFSKFFLFCKEYQLTAREQDIMTLLLKNMTNEQISEELHISIGTAKTHIHNIYMKLDVKKRRQLLERYNDYF